MEKLNREKVLEFLRSPEIKKEFQKHHMNHIYLIGSFARDEANNKSDIDIMYEKSDVAGVTFLELVAFKRNLEEKIHMDLDMVNEKFLYKNLKPYIDKDKILVF